MSKRHQFNTSSSSATRSRKRQRGHPDFGAPSEFDQATPQNTPTTSALSTRTTLNVVPSLVTISATAFSKGFRWLYDENHRAQTSRALRRLPDGLARRVFTVLREDHPTFLHNDMICQHFVRPPEVVLTGDLPAITPITLRSVTDLGSQLRVLQLTGLTKMSDDHFASVVIALPELESLVLKGSAKVGENTVTAISHLSRLRVLNLNYTTPPPLSLAPVIANCSELEILKLAAIPKMTAHMFVMLVLEVEKLANNVHHEPLAKLRTLKLKETGVNDAGVSSILKLTPDLTSLDLSITSIKSLACLGSPCMVPKLEKLGIMRTGVAPNSLLALSALPRLQKLNIGALNQNENMIMTDGVLHQLTGVLQELPDLESVSLVGNAKLGATSRRGEGALAVFVSQVGRKCKRLNLGGIPNLSSLDLSGLIADDGSACHMDSLTLNNTVIDDDAAVFISVCHDLEALSLENTRVTNEGVFTIINACPNLLSLNLKSCRGIPLADRRRFFEVWEESRDAPVVEEAPVEGRRRSGRARR